METIPKLTTIACHQESALPLTVTPKTSGLLASLTNTAIPPTTNANNKCAPTEQTPNAEVDFVTPLTTSVSHVTLEHHATLALLANVTQLVQQLLALKILNAPILLKIATPLTDNVRLKDVLQALTAEQTHVILLPTFVLPAPRPELQLLTVPLATTAKIQNAWFKDLAAPITAPALTSPKLVILQLDSAKSNLAAQTQMAADQTYATQAPESAKLAQFPKDQLTLLETAHNKSPMIQTTTTNATQLLESAK